MKPHSLDEYPVHQSPLSMARTSTTDRNFYDRAYFNGHDRSGERFFVSGFGHYPNLGVQDAFATLREGDRQVAVRFSDALDERSTTTKVGAYALEVIEPLERVRLVCEHPDLSFDITWEGSFAAVLEEQHTLMGGPRAILEATRFAQVGTWSGTLAAFGTEHAVDPDLWLGSRDRSWGIRPVGDGDPAGRMADEPTGGHWWTYVPLRFDDYMLMIIVQESPDGTRTLNHATRVWRDGRVEQLGWPRVEVDYVSGTRNPASARIHLTTRDGAPVVVDVEPLTYVALHIGAGYGGDTDWTHGQWMGRDWSLSSTYDLTDPEIAARVPWGTVDFSARATCDGQEGWGMFEHMCFGRHDPSGFSTWTDMAP